jgi:phage virion morphogenesis protein
VTVTLDAEGAIDLMDEMGTRVLDLSEVLRVIASDLITFADDSFEQSRSPSGVAWEPLKVGGLIRTATGLADRKPLIDTGTLRNSITSVPGVSAILVGTNVPYAGPHQFGTVHIPARPFLPFTADGEAVTTGPAEEEWERYEELIAHYIETGEILQG